MSTNLVFRMNELRKCRFINITNDNRVETLIEQFMLEFNIPSSLPFSNAIETLTGMATVEIMDDDSELTLASLLTLHPCIVASCVVL